MLPFPCMHSLRLWSGACDNAHLGPQTQASGPGLVLEREALGAATLHSGCILQSALSINPPSTLCCAYVPDIRRRISRHARPYSLRVNRPRPRPRHGFSARVTRIIAMMKQPTRNAIHSASLQLRCRRPSYRPCRLRLLLCMTVDLEAGSASTSAKSETGD